VQESVAGIEHSKTDYFTALLVWENMVSRRLKIVARKKASKDLKSDSIPKIIFDKGGCKFCYTLENVVNHVCDYCYGPRIIVPWLASRKSRTPIGGSLTKFFPDQQNEDAQSLIDDLMELIK
jgi:hypothetical protein